MGPDLAGPLSPSAPQQSLPCTKKSLSEGALEGASYSTGQSLHGFKAQDIALFLVPHNKELYILMVL